MKNNKRFLIYLIIIISYFAFSIIRNSCASKLITDIEQTAIDYEKLEEYEKNHSDEWKYEKIQQDGSKARVLLKVYSGISFVNKLKCAYGTYNHFGTDVRVEFSVLWNPGNEYDKINPEWRNSSGTRWHPFQQIVIDILCRREWYFIFLRCFLIAIMVRVIIRQK